MFTSEVDTGLLSYLQENNTGEEYLFATLTTVIAAPYIIHTDESVMALRGFNGTDPILTVSELKKFIKEGKVKYFLLSSDNSGNSELVSWIKKNGTVVSTAVLQAVQAAQYSKACLAVLAAAKISKHYMRHKKEAWNNSKPLYLLY